MHIENVIFLILSKNAYTKFSARPTYLKEGGKAFLQPFKLKMVYLVSWVDIHVFRIRHGSP